MIEPTAEPALFPAHACLCTAVVAACWVCRPDEPETWRSAVREGAVERRTGSVGGTGAASGVQAVREAHSEMGAA